MASLSDNEIAAAAAAGGFSGLNQTIAVAVALAESGGRTTAIANEPDGSHSYGLWQINSVHTDVLRMGNWQDPNTNAKMAFRIFTENRGWTPWSTYNNMRYQMFMSRAQIAVPNAASANTTTGLDNIPGLSSAADAVKFFKFIADPHNWYRLALILTGAVLLIIVAIVIMGHSDSVKEVVKQSGKIAEVAAL
jgi:hypothetical protein